MHAVGRTNIGKVRVQNEDALYLPQSPEDLQNVYIVADGMGGQNAGEIASNLAVREAVSVLRYLQTDTELTEKEKVYQAIAEANQKVYAEMQHNSEYRGMGTTFTMALVGKDGRMFIGHVGDSRAYRLREGTLAQLTTDHSFVQELLSTGRITDAQARVHPMRNVITRSLGTTRFVDIDVFTTDIQQDDLFLLCSDGLSNALLDQELASILSMETLPLESRADMLVGRALDSGGHDNITVLLVSFAEGGHAD